MHIRSDRLTGWLGPRNRAMRGHGIQCESMGFQTVDTKGRHTVTTDLPWLRRGPASLRGSTGSTISGTEDIGRAVRLRKQDAGASIQDAFETLIESSSHLDPERPAIKRDAHVDR